MKKKHTRYHYLRSGLHRLRVGPIRPIKLEDIPPKVIEQLIEIDIKYRKYLQNIDKIKEVKDA